MRFGLLLCALAGPGCVATIEFDSVPSAQVTVEEKDHVGAGKLLGYTPLEVGEPQVEGKIVKLEAPGRVPQYFAFSNAVPGAMRLKVDLAAGPREAPETASGPATVPLEQVNKINRRLLAVVQAILKQDYKTANELARNVADNNPRLAAPWVLEGLANLYDGDRDSARAAFKNAQSLDPGDHDLVEMLKVLQ